MSRGDVFGDTYAALIQAKKDAILAGGFLGFKQPKIITGNFYRPVGYNGSGTGITSTATRCYYFPLIILETRTYDGASIINSSAGDTGEKIRLMVFRDDLSTGGPGTLEKDFGEITLTAAVAVRTLSSSWTAKAGVYWGAVWCDSATALSGMMPYVTNGAGTFTQLANLHNLTGDVSPSDSRSVIAGYYVDTTYGAAPSTAVAFTNSLSTLSAGTDTGLMPAFWLKG